MQITESTSPPAQEGVLNLDNIIWVDDSPPFDRNIYSQRFRGRYRKEQSVEEYWREHLEPSEEWPTPIFPERDSNNNPCRILHYMENQGDLCGVAGPNTIVYQVAYPDGEVRSVYSKTIYNQHIGLKLTPLAESALTMWPEGETRICCNYSSQVSTSLTPEMWMRATVQGYITPATLTARTGSNSKFTRTSKKIIISLPRRSLKISAWPFSEKTHWLKVAQGPLQVTRINLTEVLLQRENGRSSLTASQRTELEEAYPVFKTHAEFKRARKIFEHISVKKHKGGTRSHAGTSQGMCWDPLKQGFSDLAKSNSSHSLFFSPYALVKTSLMLACIPKIEDDGSIQNYEELTPERITKHAEETPILKQIFGLWADKYMGHVIKYRIDLADYNPILYHAIAINNLTHMYMVLLNESRLLSNDDLLKWCQYQGLHFNKLRFDTDYVPNRPQYVFGYTLTPTLKYVCLIPKFKGN